MAGTHSGGNRHHSFNPWFICNMLIICNINFIVLDNKGTRKKKTARSDPFPSGPIRKIPMCETDHRIKCHHGAIRQRESNDPICTRHFFLILCKNSINEMYVFVRKKYNTDNTKFPDIPFPQNSPQGTYETQINTHINMHGIQSIPCYFSLRTVSEIYVSYHLRQIQC